MIQSKDDYIYFLKADEIALGIKKKSLIADFFDEILKFQRLLRKTEYFLNCKHSPLEKLYCSYLRFRLHRMQVRLGFSIGLNCFGPGLAIAHTGTIVVSRHAKIGANCRIYPCAVIGVKPQTTEAPAIGDNVYIGPGAKIFGKIRIADGIAIGANAVVNRSFLEPNITIAGVPARKVSNTPAKLIRATELLGIS